MTTGVSIVPGVYQSTVLHVPADKVFAFGGPYTDGDKGIGKEVMGHLKERSAAVPKMPEAQSQLSQTPSVVQKTAQKVSKLSLAWSVLWRVVVSLPLLGALGWCYLHQARVASNNPENKMIKSLETPTDITYTVGSKQEPCTTRGDRAPLIGSRMKGTSLTVTLPSGKSITVSKQVFEKLKGGFQKLKVFDIQGNMLEEIPAIKALQQKKDQLTMEPVIQKHPFLSHEDQAMLLRAFREKGIDDAKLTVYKFDDTIIDNFRARLPDKEKMECEDYVKAYNGPNKSAFSKEVRRLFDEETDSRKRHFDILELLQVEPAFNVMEGEIVAQLAELRADALGSWMGVDGPTAFSAFKSSDPMSVLQVFLTDQFMQPFSEEEGRYLADLTKNGGEVDMQRWPGGDTSMFSKDRLERRPEIHLQPPRAEGNDTIYPVQVTWQTRLNFKDGTYNDYVINQMVEIRQKGDGSPCEIRERRSVNSTREQMREEYQAILKRALE